LYDILHSRSIPPDAFRYILENIARHDQSWQVSNQDLLYGMPHNQSEIVQLDD
jgi:hypothetical protein